MAWILRCCVVSAFRWRLEEKFNILRVITITHTFVSYIRRSNARPPYCWGIMHWSPLSVCLSVCLSRTDRKSRTEGCRKLKIDTKEAHGTGDPWPDLEVERSNACRGRGNFGVAQLVCFTGTLMSNDVKAESCLWLFKLPLAGGILWRLHCRLL